MTIPSKITARYRVLILLVFISPIIIGCSQQPIIDPSPDQTEPVDEVVITMSEPCDEFNTMNLLQAFRASKQNLSRDECKASFDRNFEQLKNISKGDPKLENRALFASWLAWANQSGIISVKRSKDYYNRYFNTTFISLPTHGNICAHLSRDQLTSRLDAELKQKYEGYNEILADKAGYNDAYSQYTDMTLMLQSLKVACDIENRST